MRAQTKYRIQYWIAVFFGSGLSPFAPGTMGSLASFVIWGPVVMLDMPWYWRIILVSFITIIGIWASGPVAKQTKRNDPSEVVIDEVAGLGLTLALCGPTFFNLIAGFLLFRLFDIWKPGPIRWAERSFPGGTGIMLDDIMAGLFALGALTLLSILA